MKKCGRKHCDKSATTKVTIKLHKAIEEDHELCNECADDLVLTHAGAKEKTPYWIRKSKQVEKDGI